MEANEHSQPRRSWLRRLLNRLEVDRAVFYSAGSRIWQFLAGPVTILLIAKFFSPETQGYFYTFSQLMMLQTLVELGLHTVIVALASHEWAHLSLDEDGAVTGEPRPLARLADLKRMTFRLYGVIALLFVLGVGLGGLWFLGQTPPGETPGQESDIAWQAPWIGLVIINGGLIALWPLIAILEGCNQVHHVNRVRFGQATTGNLAVWLSIGLGCGLWAAVVSAGVRLLWELWLVFGQYRSMMHSLADQPPSGLLLWREEILPLQWRLAVRSLTSYFAFGLFTPVIFHYHGEAAAGRVGMTWSALLALEAAALAWIQTRIPLFGMLAARRDWAEMDRIFFRLTGIVCLIFLLGSLAFLGVLIALPSLPFELAPQLAGRMLSPETTALFCAALFLLLIPRCQSYYIFAHKRDPYVWLSVSTSALAGPAVWWGGKHNGALGEAVGFLAVVALVMLPTTTWIWWRTRREWHR